jgi:hypothetical protein
MGVTSRGLFIQLSPSEVVFLSAEVYRGPLSLNFPAEAADWYRIKQGDRAWVHAYHIHFPQVDLAFDLAQAETWEVPAPVGEAQSLDQRRRMLAQVVELAMKRGRTSLVSELLPVLCGLRDRSAYAGNAVLADLERLRRHAKDGDAATVAIDLGGFLGLGMGLTPSGDDLVMGFSLTVNRWGHVLKPGLDLQAIKQVILPLVASKTTTLSANLISCALEGQADERLILALDGLMSVRLAAETCAGYLTSWGNTSGLDALMGMALII